MAEAVMEDLGGSMPMTIAIITDSGQHLADRQFPTAGAGYQRIFDFIIRSGARRRGGTGSCRRTRRTVAVESNAIDLEC